MQLYDHGEADHRKGACCAGQDIHDARLVAARLGIPHYVLDYEERFHARVIDPLHAELRAGETPVPCIYCNSEIKFARPVRHRARPWRGRARHRAITSRRDATRRAAARFIAPSTAERDQSYFLFATTKAQLRLLRFPLGDMTKTDVRALARRFGLLVADKADSQDICFVPDGQYSDLIERLSPGAAVPGEIVASRRPRARPPRRRHPLHHRPEARPWPWRQERRRAALRHQARRRAGARHRRSARGAARRISFTCAI